MSNKNKLAVQRQEHIMKLIGAVGAVRVTDLVADLGVSDMTIRRDIGELAERGLVRKVHGGAVENRPVTRGPEPVAPMSRLSQKKAIAAAAVKLIRPGSSVAISVGTTTGLLASKIAETPALRPLTVVTNSLGVSDTLSATGDRELEVLLVGGTRTPNDALVGPPAVEMLRRLRFDQLFLGVHGVSAELGLTTPNLLEGETDQAFIASANEVVVLADHTKWQTVGLSAVAPLSAIHVLISDEGLSSWEQDAARALVGRLELAKVPGTA